MNKKPTDLQLASAKGTLDAFQHNGPVNAEFHVERLATLFREYEVAGYSAGVDAGFAKAMSHVEKQLRKAGCTVWRDGDKIHAEKRGGMSVGCGSVMAFVAFGLLLWGMA